MTRTTKTANGRAAVPEDEAEPETADTRALLWSRPGFLIRRLLQIHNGLYFEECGEWNITPLQYGMMTILRGATDGLDIRSLAAELGVDRSNTADVARRLASRGLIVQQTAPADKRMVISRLTEAGAAMLDQTHAAMHRSQMTLLEPLDPETRATVLGAITHLVRFYNDKGRAKLRL
jgi:DNA-binding MarR family transcriptional regulator